MVTNVSAVVVVNRREPFWLGFWAAVADIVRSRRLLFSLIRKELSIRYRGSVLGILWTMIKPLVQLTVYGLVLGVFLGFGDQIPDFGFFMFCGLMIFGLFSEAVTAGTTSVLWNASLVKKVALRRELLPLSTTGVALVNFFFQALVLVAAFAIVGDWPELADLPFIVPALLIVLLLGLACGMLLGALNVYVRDVQFIVDVGLLLLFWLTPILYGWWTVQETLAARGLPDWAFDVYMGNPLAAAAVAFQQGFWPGQPAQYEYFDSVFALRLWGTVAVCAVLVWLAQRIFNRLQENFAAEL
jgi:ABC-2 type transport system permease protein